MTARTSKRHGVVAAVWLTIGAVAGLGWLSNPCFAADFLEGFDGPETSWTLAADSPDCRVVDHRRHAQIRKFGTGSENVILDVPHAARAEMTHGLSPARVLNEPLTANVWLRSNRSGAKFSIRLVYPHLTDPQTRQIVYRWLERHDGYGLQPHHLVGTARWSVRAAAAVAPR